MIAAWTPGENHWPHTRAGSLASEIMYHSRCFKSLAGVRGCAVNLWVRLARAAGRRPGYLPSYVYGLPAVPLEAPTSSWACDRVCETCSGCVRGTHACTSCTHTYLINLSRALFGAGWPLSFQKIEQDGCGIIRPGAPHFFHTADTCMHDVCFCWTTCCGPPLLRLLSRLGGWRFRFGSSSRACDE